MHSIGNKWSRPSTTGMCLVCARLPAVHLPYRLPYLLAGLCFRLKAVDSEGDDATVEAQLQAQLEQLTEMCNDELGLIPQMAGAPFF